MGSALLVSPFSLSFSLCLAWSPSRRSSTLSPPRNTRSLLAVFVVFALSNHEWICKPGHREREGGSRRICWQSYRNVQVSSFHSFILFSYFQSFLLSCPWKRSASPYRLSLVLTSLCVTRTRLTK